MGLYNHALYQVATKALIFDNDKLLVLETPDGYVDFPGGRVDETERNIPWTEALKREIAEEVGEALEVEIGQTLFVSKRRYHKEGAAHHIAAIFFRCNYLSGAVTLSDEHGSYSWQTPEELLQTDKPFISDDEKSQLTKLLETGRLALQ